MAKSGGVLAKAVKALRAGKPLVLFDGEAREGEADIVLHASFASPEKVAFARKAGGLLCVATDARTAKAFGLPFLNRFFKQKGGETLKRVAYSRTAYGDEPAFSISFNHESVFTGITDGDRSLTLKRFAQVVASRDGEAFAREFRAPGHVQLLVSRGLRARRGHTELGVWLCELAGLAPAAVLCELLGGKGKALSRGEARAFAKKRGLVFVEGKAVMLYEARGRCLWLE